MVSSNFWAVESLVGSLGTEMKPLLPCVAWLVRRMRLLFLCFASQITWTESIRKIHTNQTRGDTNPGIHKIRVRVRVGIVQAVTTPAHRSVVANSDWRFENGNFVQIMVDPGGAPGPGPTLQFPDFKHDSTIYNRFWLKIDCPRHSRCSSLKLQMF